MKNFYAYQTGIGKLWIVEEDGNIARISFSPVTGIQEGESQLIRQVYRQIDEYLYGKRKVFELPLNPEGTPFQKKVWEVLRTIPYGETWSYKRVAEAAGNVKACRAVGMANNRNPIAVVVPCHRVIGADGKLVGYAGGLSIKEHLLQLEQDNNNAVRNNEIR